MNLALDRGLSGFINLSRDLRSKLEYFKLSFKEQKMMRNGCEVSVDEEEAEFGLEQEIVKFIKNRWRIEEEAPENSSNSLNSGSYERFCKNVLDPISVSNPFKVQIDAIAEEVQKKNQVASKIALAVMSKLDGKPDDVHDEEYHTMIEGMLSNKEFRKALPAGLVEQYYDLTCGYSRPDQFGPAPSSFSESDNLNLFNKNLCTILINATKKATNATAAILGNHNKTTNPGTFLSASTVAMAPHPNSS
ncbi:hypothetical protein PPACK8108_LOCUS10816 [Phakopsora pachyrhizi]|uniref:Uncharacterized protein n=1 Tax=Phakopsora pachyrhizi TaxID=170000 RepID=A0AAV0AZ05_PHAPC|nr:hypothetical protein PPACK8108_LOCUS10816 [Phakopsora pachyrhizi]